ncbi:MAG: hypothetical protein ABW214_01440 [Terrimicrobiaceae bacterium]
MFYEIPATDWKILARIISALEYAGVDSLSERPVEITDCFGETWVIG